MQIPPTKPSRSLTSAWISFLTSSLRKKVAISLPDPSGSSLAENPPLRNKIWDSDRSFANCLMLETTRSGLIVLITKKISGSPPQYFQARSISYSQLVPSKTGSRIFGFFLWIAGMGVQALAIVQSRNLLFISWYMYRSIDRGEWRNQPLLYSSKIH